MTEARRGVAFTVLCAGFLMVTLDSTIVNVALPSIQSDLGFSQADLAWVVNAYLVAFGGLLLLAGRLGDLVGRRRMFLLGLAVFTLASMLCGLAQTSLALVAGRFLQGAGGAMASAVILGMIVRLFPEPGEQARAIGAYSFVGAGGAALGLVVGGLLTQAIDWHWIFFVNGPIGVAALLAAARWVEPDRGLGLSRGADVPGGLLSVAALMLAVYAIVTSADGGGLTSLALGAAALLLAVGFVAREARAASPLVPLGVFRSRRLSSANAIQMLMVAGLFGQQFLITLYLQRVRGFDAIELGLGNLPIVVSVGVVSLGLAARVMARFGPRATLTAGLGAVAAGLAVFAGLDVDGSYLADVVPGMVLVGVGAGLAFPAVVSCAMSDASPDEAGLASGLVNTTQQIGFALGLAVLAAVSSWRTDELLGAGHTLRDALTGGYRAGFAVAAAVAVAAALLTVVLLPRSPGQRDLA